MVGRRRGRTGEINFPNLKLSQTKLDFGSVLNDTTKRMNLTITNVSKVDCVYNWSFMEDEEDGAVVPPAASTKKKSKAPKLRSSQASARVPLAQRSTHLQSGCRRSVAGLFRAPVALACLLD